MNTNNTIILNFIERMVNDGYSESRITKIKGQMNKLLNYVVNNDINEEMIISFVKDNYNFDYYNPINHNQLDKIKYLKNLLEFKDTGNYLKRHSNSVSSDISLFPVQIVETIVFLSIFIYMFMKHSKKQFNLNTLGVSFILCGLSKFLLDFLKMSHKNIFLSLNQYISIVFVIIGFIICFNKKIS